MRNILAALIAAPLLTGCLVAQSTYDAKQAELDAAKQEESQHDQANAAKVKELEAQIDKLQKDLASSQLLNGDLSDQLKKLGQNVQNLAAEKGNLSESLAAAQKQMEALQKQEEQERARAALYHQLVQKLKSMIDSGKLAVQVRNGKMLVKLQNDILFAAGSAAVKPEGKEVIAQLAQVLASVPDRNFQVTGHTDDVPIHSAQFPSNWELSSARAINVVNILTGAGLDPKHVSAAGYADNDPVAPNDSPDNKQKNRRIEIVVQPNIDELPHFDDNAGATADATPAK
ncbi:MAG: OmpA family protein [Deltaproteobacteria bacterium]|nr:OmpA family protein [Deltaproteobacteria bacterium]